MITKKFKLEELEQLIYEDSECFVNISDEITNHSRWEVVHEMVFQEKETGKFYSVCYEEPATEYQDCDRFDVDSNGEVKCVEVVPVQVTVTQYKRKE